MVRSNSGRIRSIVVASVASFGLVLGACPTDGDSEGKSAAAGNEIVVTVTDNHGEQTIPVETDTVVATDNRSFEMLDQWGIKLAAAPRATIPFTVSGYKDNPDVQGIDNHREPNLEIVAAADPGLIVTGQRFDKYYDGLKKLAPNSTIVDFEPRKGKPLDEELKRHAKGMGIVFGREKEADQLIADFDKALERAHKAYNPDVTVMILSSSGGTLGYIVPTVGRTFGPLFDLIDMKPVLEVDKASDDHQGDEVLAESIAKMNPDFIMVLDRDTGASVRGTDEYCSAQSVVGEAAPLKNVKIVKEGEIYYAPEDTYTNGSIITYTETLNELADAFE